MAQQVTVDALRKAAKRDLANSLFGGKCFACHRRYGKHFAFHHLRYHPTELKHSDFSSTGLYNAYIIPIVRRRPRDFLLLCRKCHRHVETLHAMSPGRRSRTVLASMLTTTGNP